MTVSKAIIVAGGQSKRMEGLDKTFAEIAGMPVIAHTIAAFEASPSIGGIVLVLPGDKIAKGRELVDRHRFGKIEAICAGGPETRQQSVANGLAAVGECDIILIHDGARPCVTTDSIERAIREAKREGAALAAVPAHETMKRVSAEGHVEEALERGTLWSAHTPQAFWSEIIRNAHMTGIGGATDDAMLAEMAGYNVKVFEDSYDNIKITTRKDLATAESILLQRRASSPNRKALSVSR